jgi:predicted PurR-regulated permease PerM
MDELPVTQQQAQPSPTQPPPQSVPVEPASAAVSPASHWGAAHLLALLVCIAAAWAARELLVPVMLALFLALIANPFVTRMRKLHIPRWIGGFFVVFGGVAIALTLASQLFTPATEWVQRAPEELRQVAPKLKSMVKKVDEANKAAASIVSAAGAGQTGSTRNEPVVADQPKPINLWKPILATPRILAIIGAVILLSYFFVVYGLDLMRQAVSLLPERRQRSLSVDILHDIEAELSRYVLTIATINAVLAFLLTMALWWLGLDLGDALFWGAVGGVLNFAPYVGPVVGVVLLSLVGVVAFDQPLQMLLPPAIYLALQALETEVVTPIILGRTLSISPLIVLLWLLFCGWLWNIAGILLAVPMLVSFKIVAGRIEGLKGWAKVIER